MQILESAINDVVFLGIAIAFLVTIEARIRRHRLETASSPSRPLTPFQLGRYLDYCSELLSITSKVAALYAQQLEDPVVLDAVNEVETLVTGLSGKIWQKLVILGNLTRALPS